LPPIAQASRAAAESDEIVFMMSRVLWPCF
jgi:hypothetical protein